MPLAKLMEWGEGRPRQPEWRTERCQLHAITVLRQEGYPLAGDYAGFLIVTHSGRYVGQLIICLEDGCDCGGWRAIILGGSPEGHFANIGKAADWALQQVVTRRFGVEGASA